MGSTCKSVNESQEGTMVEEKEPAWALCGVLHSLNDMYYLSLFSPMNLARKLCINEPIHIEH